MHAKEYAQVLFDLGRKNTDPENLMENFLSLVRSRGHLKLLPRILSEYERLSAVRSRSEGIIARVATGEAKKLALEKVREISQSHGEDYSEVKIVEDENLIKGFSLEGREFRYDASARRQLIEMYKSMTRI